MNQACVVVTGSGGGIGRAVCQTLVDADIKVIGIDVKPVEAGADHLQFDLSQLVDDNNAANALGDQILELADDATLTGVINLAAIQLLGDVASLEIESYLHSFKVNVLAPLVLARTLLPALSANHATVINISSIHAALSKRSFSAYSISKAAMSGLTRSLAIELGSQLRIIEIRPAAIATDMLEAGFVGDENGRRELDRFHPTGSIGRPDDVASLCLSILRNQSAFMNGAVINLDGGIAHVLHDPQ